MLLGAVAMVTHSIPPTSFRIRLKDVESGQSGLSVAALPAKLPMEPIIPLSLATVVTVSSTYCLFQIAVLPKVVVLRPSTMWSATWCSLIVLILKNLYPGAFDCVQLMRIALATSPEVMKYFLNGNVLGEVDLGIEDLNNIVDRAVLKLALIATLCILLLIGPWAAGCLSDQ